MTTRWLQTAFCLTLTGSWAWLGSLPTLSGQQLPTEAIRQEAASAPTGTASTGLAILNDQDELNIETRGEVISYTFNSLAIVNAKGEAVPAGRARQVFESSQPIVFVENPTSLVDFSQVFQPDVLVIYYPVSAYNLAAQASMEAAEIAQKNKAIIACVYNDEKTKLEGLTQITAMRINGEDVSKNEVVLGGDLLQFSRKHTRSEVHIFGLKPGEYEVEFEAEAIFEGKFHKTSVGKGKFTVAQGNALGTAVFTLGR